MTGEEIMQADVLVLGGGLAGCFAAIKAAENGASVILLEKADIRRSGNGATGLHRIPLIHPDYNMSFEEFARLNVDAAAGICDKDLSYEFARDTLDRVLDLESYGLPMRRKDGSFILKPAPDIAPGNVAIWGPGPTSWHDVKPALARKVHESGTVTVYNRVAAVGLLTEDGEVGSPVNGVVGLGTRSGKFVQCSAKAVILTTGGSYRLGRNKDSLYSPSRFVECGCPTNCGDGQAMVYRAGGELANMEFPKLSPQWKDFTHWGIGPPSAVGQKLGGHGQPLTPRPGVNPKRDLYQRTYNYGFHSEGPFYCDVSNVPGYPHEEGEMQEFLWALENESTNHSYLLWMKERGEDFREAPVEFEWHPSYLHNNQGGVYIDVNACSSLDGLYCAGDVIGGGWRQSSGGAFVFGARAGIHAAEYVRSKSFSEPNPEQVEAEKERILESTRVKDEGESYSWVDLEDKARKIASEYGPPFTSDAKLSRGLHHLERIKNRYLPKMQAKSIREMLRAAEVKSVFSCVELHLRSALFRKESRSSLVSILYKTEYPEQDDSNWKFHTVVKKMKGEPVINKKKVH